MKAKVILLIILSSLLLGCSTRKKKVSISEFGKTEIEKIKADSVVEQKQEQKEIVSKTETIDKQKENLESDISIVGKTDSIHPFLYHNIINGDTLQAISIFGNANFKINNNYKKTSEKSEEKKDSEKLNIVQELARKSVAKSTIKEVAAEVRKVDKQIKERSFTFGAWLVWIIGFVVVAVLVWLYFYFGGKINFRGFLERLNKRR